MSNTAASVLDVARSQLGVKSGRKYWDYVMGSGYISGGATPWCACFVSWVFHEAGAKCAGLPSASCTYGIYAKAKAAGKLVSVDRAQPGDVILFNFDGVASDAEHTGIIESVGATTFVTIEGNTSDTNQTAGGTVAKKVRKKSSTFAIVRPDYAASGKDEWVKQDGRWWYRHADGSYTTNGWERIDGKWYYFDAKGWMVTGWVKWKGKWCYCEGSGACAYSKCLCIKGKWYAFDHNGYMVEGMVWVEDSGALKI